MSEQLSLTGPPKQLEKPPLTKRQQHALDHLTAAGHAGRSADEVGAQLCARRGKHDADDRCVWCAKAGNEVLRALRRKRLVKQRRDGTGMWEAIDLAGATDDRFPAFNAPFPEGF